jgi:hypothetical protein
MPFFVPILRLFTSFRFPPLVAQSLQATAISLSIASWLLSVLSSFSPFRTTRSKRPSRFPFKILPFGTLSALFRFSSFQHLRSGESLRASRRLVLVFRRFAFPAPGMFPLGCPRSLPVKICPLEPNLLVGRLAKTSVDDSRALAKGERQTEMWIRIRP